ncbi:MAG: cytochrome c peroxidase [Candidatus Competibacter sp.]
MRRAVESKTGDGRPTLGSRRALAALSLAAGLALAQPAPVQYSTAADSHEAIVPLPPAVAVDPAQVALGERLFRDARLSQDRDMACTACHDLQSGGDDGLPRAKTAGGAILTRNSPTIFNVAFNFSYNWDGVADTLEAHADRLLLNPKIMRADWPELLARLKADADTVRAFAAAYPDGVTKLNVLSALASYQRSLITPDARFDRYLRGEAGALTVAERQGYALFTGYGCVACHQGANIGGNMYQKFGVFEDVLTPAPQDAATPDLGRYNITQIERDRGVFRVPSLRNVALTAPYFHDGRAATLEEAVRTMARVQLGKTLPPDEIDLIVQFLKSLTGEYQGRPLAAPASEHR